MAGRLNTYVHVVGEVDGERREGTFGPGDPLPNWAAEAITNPKVWAEQPEPEPEPAARPARVTEPPALAGSGSARGLWVEYAEANGLTVAEDDTRGDIIESCRKAGIPVE